MLAAMDEYLAVSAKKFSEMTLCDWWRATNRAAIKDLGGF